MVGSSGRGKTTVIKKMMRDMSSKAIINTNVEELRAYRDRKQAMNNIDNAMIEINNTKPLKRLVNSNSETTVGYSAFPCKARHLIFVLSTKLKLTNK